MLINSKQTVTGKVGMPRKLYRKPQLEYLGDLRSITLGSSPMGTPDSNFVGAWNNNAPVRMPPGFPLPDGSPRKPGESTQP